jgi:hypothetical protein
MRDDPDLKDGAAAAPLDYSVLAHLALRVGAKHLTHVCEWRQRDLFLCDHVYSRILVPIRAF